MFLKSNKPSVTKSLFVLCFVFYFNFASSHPDASAVDFCPSGQIMSSSQHSVDGDFLTDIFKNSKNVECPVGISLSSNPELDKHVGHTIIYNNPTKSLMDRAAKTHDVFDGQARMAYTYASCICSSLVNKKINLDERRPLLTGPDSLLDETHHDNYRLSEGLKFICNVCVNPRDANGQ